MNTLMSWNLQLQLKSVTLFFDIIRLIFFFHVQCLLLVTVLAAVPLTFKQCCIFHFPYLVCTSFENFEVIGSQIMVAADQEGYSRGPYP